MQPGSSRDYGDDNVDVDVDVDVDVEGNAADKLRPGLARWMARVGTKITISRVKSRIHNYSEAT